MESTEEPSLVAACSPQEHLGKDKAYQISKVCKNLRKPVNCFYNNPPYSLLSFKEAALKVMNVVTITRPGVDKVKLCWTVPPCPGDHLAYLRCTEFAYPRCWDLEDNGATRKIDDVLLEHDGLLDVLPLAINLKYFLVDNKRGLF